MPPISRRTFLLGGVGALALAACGGDDDDTAADATTTTATAAALTVYRVFAPMQPAGVPLRLPIALADPDGALLDDAPASIAVSWGLEGETERSEPVEIPRHADGIPTPYFPVQLTFPSEGDWELVVRAGDAEASTSVRVVPATELPAVPGPGDQLISLQTPTVTDGRSVDPICTRDPACPFHEQSLEAAMASGKAIALIVSTPQFCQTAICGPVLDLLVERRDEYAETIAFVHAEVYTDRSASTTTETVQAYGLTYEPALFLAAPDGTINVRLDYTFDGAEVEAALSKLVQ